MYSKIEEQFKQESKLRMSQILFVLFLLFSSTMYVIFFYDWIMKNYLFAVAVLAVGLIVGIAAIACVQKKYNGGIF